MASAGSISKITLPSQATYDLKDAEARAALSAKSAVSVDGGRADVDIRHISKDDYEALVARGAALSNTLYLVSADYVDAYGQQIRNIQPGSALSDAASYGQVLSVAETALTAVPPEYKTYAQTILTLSADGYAIGVKVNGEVKKAVQGGAAADRGIVDIGTVLSAVPDTYKTYSDTTTALTASSGFKTYAQTMQGLSADGYATKADTTLTTIPDGNWIADPPTVEYQDTQVTTPIPHWYQDSGVVPEYFWEGAGWYVADSPGDYTYFGNDSRADSFSYTVLGSIPVVATRTLGSGYRLGPDDASNPNRDKPLASQDQMDVVAAQAAKADTAIQGVKLNGTALTADSGNVVNVTALTAHQAVSAVYSGQHIYLSANGARVGDIDCGDFVKDSVLSSAELCGSTLVFKFKVTSGQPQDPISVQLSSFIDDYDSDISQINQKITALSGSGVVHVTGDETAAGKKTFSDAFTVGTRKSGTYGTKSFTYGLNNLASGEGSFAGGQNCIASEAYAVAEGYQTSALGLGSHAEGQNTLAKGGSYCSHAEGYKTVALNGYAHAEGYQTSADFGSHAEGSYSFAHNIGHAEGEYTYANGYASHAENGQTSALHNYTHAEGYGTLAQNTYEHAQGIYNVSNKSSINFGLSSNTIDSIGIGTGNARKNATEVMQNGDAYFLGVGGYDGTNAASATSKPLAVVLSAKADVDSLGYALSTAVGTLSSGSYVYDVADRTITTIGINQSSTPVVVRLPAASAYARDFIVRIEISSAAAPSFTFANADGLTFESEDDDWAVMEPGLNIVSFTETKR